MQVTRLLAMTTVFAVFSGGPTVMPIAAIQANELAAVITTTKGDIHVTLFPAEAPLTVPNNPADLVGVEGYRDLITLYTTMFSDLRFEIHDIVAEGDIVCSRWTSVGTHDGEVLGIAPTGNSLTRTGMSWQRVENGKFVETWVERDGLGLARDIGAVPPE